MAKPVVTARILRRLLESGIEQRAQRLLERIHTADIGPLLSDLTREEMRAVIEMLFQQRRAGQVLREIPVELLPDVFDVVPDESLSEMISRMQVDDALWLFEALPAERRDSVGALMPTHKRTELDRAQLYAPNSAGRVMTTGYVALDAKMTAQEAIDSIRAWGENAETILYLYVIDEERRLLGTVPIRRLVQAPPERPCAELMTIEPIHARVDDDQEEVARLVARYDLLAVPLIDADGTMCGVITVDDVIEVIDEEATEDMYHLAGLGEEDFVFTTARQSIVRRLPWMVLNLAAVFVIARVVGFYEETIEQLVVLAAFLPVVAGMGGNGGIQSLTVITRAIALGELEFSSGMRAVGKELFVGLTIGASVGLLSAVIVTLWQGNATLGAVLFVAMLCTMAVAGLLGAAVPLLLKSLGMDPALGAGVIVTTLTDVFGFVCFLGIATAMLDRLI